MTRQIRIGYHPGDGDELRVVLDWFAGHGGDYGFFPKAAHGLTVWDVAPSRVEKDVAQWGSLVAWADGGKQ